jgi:2-amino-4-hydroxy-6-hydroxymethyldihydropteridine diphosphokinase
MHEVLVGLGANLGNPPAVFAAAVDGFAATGEIRSVSRLWRTRPLGPDQPNFSNAAVIVSWPGTPLELLQRCHELEAAAGRDRATEIRWGPRVLDLDLLMVRDLIWRSAALELPHPHFHKRAFALVPAAELVPGWIHPTVGRSIGELAEDAQSADLGALISCSPFTAE